LGKAVLQTFHGELRDKISARSLKIARPRTSAPSLAADPARNLKNFTRAATGQIAN
jgi:hypothetical protein